MNHGGVCGKNPGISSVSGQHMSVLNLWKLQCNQVKKGRFRQLYEKKLNYLLGPKREIQKCLIWDIKPIWLWISIVFLSGPDL